MNNIVIFNNQQIELVNRQYIASNDLAKALGYKDVRTVNRIYARNSDEFTPDMSCGVKLTPQGGQSREVRVFSLRGCHLLAMFSRTPIAKQFRVWVLDLIEKYNQPQLPAPLDAKAIGGIVKNCCAVAVREELERAATDMVYGEKFKQLARSAMTDFIGDNFANEEMLPKWRAMFQRWMKDAPGESFGKSIDAYIKAEMDERVKYFVEYVFKNYPKMSLPMKEYLITYGIVNYGKFSEYSREKDFKGICDTIARQESKDPEIKYAM